MKHTATAIHLVASLLAFAPSLTQAASIVKVTYSHNGDAIAQTIYTGPDGGPNSDPAKYWALLGKAPQIVTQAKIEPDTAGGKSATLKGDIKVSVTIRNQFSMGIFATDKLTLIRNDKHSNKWYIPREEQKRIAALFVKNSKKNGQESGESAEPADQRVKKQFKSDNYTVTWGPVATYDSNPTLEIGDGNGHGFILGWMRFLPGKDGVDVLSVRLNEDRLPHKSKWPPDRAPVTIKRARMTPNAYRELLDDLAVVNAAKLKPVRRNSASSSSFDFWVYARLTAKEKTLLDLNWAGYDGSRAEIEYAKPRAAVRAATDAVKGLEFKEHSLTDAERAWASTKFARDWKKFKDLDFHWWVRERYIITIGVVGDATALPTLLNILEGDPKDRCVYYAINTVTRLTKQDLRGKPVEEMDVDRVRRKILDAIQEGK